MSDWIHTTLGDVATLQRGFDLPVQDRTAGKYPIIASNGKVGTHKAPKVAGPGVIIGRSGSVGGGQYITEDFWPLNTTLWVKDFHGNNERFCYYLFLTVDFATFNSGSGVPTLNRNHVHPLPIYLPPRNEQDDIVRVLGFLDDKIENNRRMNETLEAMAQAIFKDWFVDFGPVHRKASGMTDPVAILGDLITDPEKATQTAALFPETLGDNGLPEGWGEGTLEKWAEVNVESWKTHNHPKQVEYVDLSNTKWGTIESTEILDWADAPSRARRIVRPSDTIVATTRPGNGSYAFISEGGLTASTGFATLKPKEKEYSQAVYCAATSPENIARLAQLADGHGGAYPAVKPIEVLASPMVSCPSGLVESFESLVFPLRTKVEHAKAENKTLAETRDYLLPRLMSGQIRAGAVGELTN